MRVWRGSGRYARIALPALAVCVALITGCQSSKIKTATVDNKPQSQGDTGPSSQTSAPAEVAETSGSATVHITWRPRDVGGKDFAPILAGYEAFITTTLTLEGAPNPASPKISQVSTGQAQQNLVKVLQQLASAKQSRHGSVTMRPLIAEADPTSGTATIDDCADFSRYFQGKDDKPAAGATKRPLEATLTGSDGDWQVASFTTGGAVACTGV